MRQPRDTQSCITCQMRSRPASISASLRQNCSLRRMTWAMLRPSRLAIASNSAPLLNGSGSTVVSGAITFCLLPSAATSSLTMKPPPTE